MNTLLLTFDFPPASGGIAIAMSQVATALKDKGVTVLASSCFDKEQLELRFKADYDIIKKDFNVSLSKWRLPFELIKVFCYCLQIFRKKPFVNFMAGEAFPFGLVGLLFKFIFGVRFIVFSHGSDALPSGRFVRDLFVKLVFKNADFVIGFSGYTCENIAKWNVEREKIKNVRFAIDTELFSPGKDTDKLKNELNLGNKFVLLTVNRLIERKGIDMVISCLSDLIREIPNALYLIVGDGPDYNRLKALVKELSLEDYVLFYGALDNRQLPIFYNICDVFINLTRPVYKKGWNQTEGLGIVNLEAAACAKPVISAATGGMAETLEHGKSGLFINPVDCIRLQQTVLGLNRNKDYARQMGEAGRRIVAEKFNMQNMKDDLYAILKAG